MSKVITWSEIVQGAKKRGISPFTMRKILKKYSPNGEKIDYKYKDPYLVDIEKAEKIALARSKNKSVRRMNLLVPNNWCLLQLLDLRKYDILNYGLADFGRLGCDEYSHIIKNEDKNINRYGEFLKISQSEGKTTLTDFTWADFYLYAALYSLEKQGNLENISVPYKGLYAKFTQKDLYEVMHPGKRYDMLSDKRKQDFYQVILNTVSKVDRTDVSYYYKGIKGDDVNKDTGFCDIILGRFLYHVIINKSFYMMQRHPDKGLIARAEAQKRVITIPREMLEYGRDEGNNAIIRFYLAYRICSNSMKKVIKWETLDKVYGGKAKRAFVKAYFKYLQDIRILKSFEFVGRTKITYKKFENSDTKFESIRVRDDNGNRIKLTGPAEIQDMKAKLDKLNTFYNRYAVTEGKNRILSTRLHASFSRGSFEFGGRLYSDGDNGFQSLKSEERKNILINGHETIELDFSALHPHILYAMKGIQYAGDPYAFSDNRRAAKKALLILINAKDEKTALAAFLHEWKKDTGSDYDGDVKVLFAKCREYHKNISDKFASDIGIRLQRLDGEMALEIAYRMQKLRVAVFPVHDSFIVDVRYRMKLKTVMQEVYKKYNLNYTCPIKSSKNEINFWVKELKKRQDHQVKSV